MSDQKKVKRASNEQKEYLLTYMEENIEFAHDRFESSDGAHFKTKKWQMLANNLNSIGGAWKNVDQWCKNWRDQKLHVKEREAFIKACFQRSGVNGIKKIKLPSPFEERVVALCCDMRTVVTPSQPPLMNTSEGVITSSAVVVASDVALESSITDLIPGAAVAGPSFAAATRPTPRKRKKAPSGKDPEISSFEDKKIKIENEKLLYIKKCYEVQEYEEKLLSLRERQVSLQEKAFDCKMNNNQ